MSRRAKLYQESSEEVKALREALASQQGSQHSNLRLISEMQGEVGALRAALQDQKTFISTLQMDANRKQERASHDMKELADKHALELAAIDSQVRQALARQEETIQRLQEANHALLRDQHEMRVGLQSVFERTN